VGYTEELPPMDNGPFLAEEQTLISTVAREIALIVERQEIAEESRRLEAQLEHAERLATIGELAAGVGHELNDPLNNILGYASFIARHEGLPEEVTRDAHIVVTSAMHARDVIRQLLTFARRMPQQRTELQLGDVVTAALPLLRALCAQSGTQVRTELASGLPPVSADPDQLRQVLVNLVANAAHAMPDGGRVTITTEADDDADAVCIVVQDTGCGMTEDLARDAFLPFFTTRDGGTGLGLPVVHGIVSAHGGTVRLESQVGKGSRFEISIPAASKEAVAGHGS
jgi:two-component system, NtrC family, sensor kinase